MDSSKVTKKMKQEREQRRAGVKEKEDLIRSVDLEWFGLNLGKHLAGLMVQVFVRIRKLVSLLLY